MAAEKTETKKRTGQNKRQSGGNNNRNAATADNALVKYFRETRGEMRKVTWPTREEAWRLTGIVLAFLVVFAAFLGAFDFLWSQAIQQLILFVTGTG